MLIIIQARTSSKRFENKVLFKINDKPIILHVIEQLKKSKFNNSIIVSTSLSKSDDKLVKYLKKKGINYFRGSLTNVADRLYKTAIYKKKNKFIRISADSPLIDSKIMDKMINISNQDKFKKFDLITNIFPRSFPKGYSVEIIKTSSLRKQIKFMDKEEKEHVTLFFYKNHKKFLIKNLKNFDKIKYKINTTVDKKKDLKNIKKLLHG